MKKIIAIFLMIVLSAGLLSGCTVETEEEKKEDGSSYFFYYLNKDETKLEKEDYTPEQETAEYMLQDLIARLNDRVMEGEKVNLLPQGVTINSYDINDSVLELEFNSKYNDISRAREVLIRTGVVKTFLQVPGLTAVKFFVGKNDLLDSKGQAVGEMTEKTFVELTGDDEESYRYDTFTLYFTDKTGQNLVEEKRSVYYRRNMPRERVILEQLAKGPMVKGHYPTISENTTIMKVTTADRVCYVNFDEVFLDYKLDVSGEVAIYSVVNSLLAAGNADKVQIIIDGNEDASLGEDLSLYNFYKWNEDIIIKETEETE